VVDLSTPEGDGHTALSPDDTEGLVLTHIATRGDLFEAEQRNIAEALLRRPPGAATLLDDRFLRDLHKRMFGNVWAWAGKYRTRETNIGINPDEIGVAVRTLVDDARVWIEYTPSESDELAVRFHHRLVAIHPFRNGNGRHGRVAADYLAQSLGRPRFTWGATLRRDTQSLRKEYHTALQEADRGNITRLLVFARS
jgi:Fic-DOC domain mobile mystery protein B